MFDGSLYKCVCEFESWYYKEKYPANIRAFDTGDRLLVPSMTRKK